MPESQYGSTHLTTSASVMKSGWSLPMSLHACRMASTIMSTASLQFFALESSSCDWMKLPLSLRDRAGSTGRALNAAYMVSCPAAGAAASDRICDNGADPLRGIGSDRENLDVVGAGELGGVARSRLFRME